MTSAMRCRLCAGTGRIVLLSGLMADMRVRSSYRWEACHFCRGTGESMRRWPEWEREQERLRAAQHEAASTPRYIQRGESGRL